MTADPGLDHDDDDVDDDEEMPLIKVTRRTVILGGLFVVLCIVFLTAVLPQLAGGKLLPAGRYTLSAKGAGSGTR